MFPHLTWDSWTPLPSWRPRAHFLLLFGLLLFFFLFLGSQIQVAIEKFEVTCVFFQNHHTRMAKPAIRRRRTITKATVVPTAREKKTIISADIKLRLKFLIVVIVGFMNLDLMEV